MKKTTSSSSNNNNNNNTQVYVVYTSYGIITFDIHEFGSCINRLSTNRDDAHKNQEVDNHYIFYIILSPARRRVQMGVHIVRLRAVRHYCCSTCVYRYYIVK